MTGALDDMQLFDPGEPDKPSLADRFVVPPFSILDSRQGYWQDRRRRWLSLGIESEVGRGDKLAFNIDQWNYAEVREAAKQRAAADAGLLGFGASKTLGDKWHSRKAADDRSNVTGAPPLPDYLDNGMANMAPGTSIFDPVLCELTYRWFTRHGARVLDPFAGGSVRGLVAALMGRHYTGIELRPEQVHANYSQVPEVLGMEHTHEPDWLIGDATDVRDLLAPADEFDLIFSCPPYADLEVYSDDPRDLSNMDYGAFRAAYETIIGRALEYLRPNRFAVWVVGEARGKDGNYYGLVPDTVKAFEAGGARLYNEAILVNVAGTASVRAPKQFNASRKLVKTHQNVLVFVKGDARKAAEAAGQIRSIDAGVSL